MAKHVANDDEQTLAKLRRNMQSLTPKVAGSYGNIKVETLVAAALLRFCFR